MRTRLIRVSSVLLFLSFQHVYAQNITPPNFKIAFIADQGLGSDSEDVLQLISDEGAQAVMHAGDFDYQSNPSAWEGQINDILGENFPYFACMGEDDSNKYFSSNGYQARLEARMNRLGLTWDGDLGVKSSFEFQGIFFVQTAAGVRDEGHEGYIEDQLAATDAIWRISTFHKNQTKMQLCGHSNATGWGVYERSREGGAFITTGQCHVYGRTHLLSDYSDQEIASSSDTLVISPDLSGTQQDEGRSFAVVSGLGGRTVHNQDTNGDWWASIYTRKQDAKFGALFGILNYNGIPNLARFYFKNVDGEIIDEFYVKTAVTGDFGLTANAIGSGDVHASPQGPVYDDGTEVTLTANPHPGWEFSGWSGDVTGSQNPVVFVMDDHKVVTATFTELPPPEYTLTLNTQGSGSVEVDPPGNVFVEGTVVTLTANAEPGFTLSGWSGDVTTSANPVSLMMDSDKTILATFVENDAPVVVNDQYSGEEDNSLTVSSPGVLANDTDPDGDPMQAALLAGPAHGTLTLNADGSFTYLPNADFNGSDSFSYQALDGRGGNTAATVELTISSVNDLPLVENETFRAILGKSISVAAPGLLSNDSDLESAHVTASLLNGPTNGSVVINSDGSFDYTAPASLVGPDTFTYLVTDGDGGSTSGSVSVEVNRGEIVHEETIVGGSSDVPSVATSQTILGVSEELYLAAISSKSARIVTSVSGLGLTWFRVDMQCSGRDQTALEIWKAKGVPTSSGRVTATFAEEPNNAVIAVSRYSGINPDTPIGEIISGNTNGEGNDCSGGTDSESYSFELTTSGASSVVYGAAALRNKTHTPENGFTEQREFSQGEGGSTAGIAVFDRAEALVSTVDIEGSFDNEVDWAVIGFEIKSSKPQFAITLNQNGDGTVILDPPGGVYDVGTFVTLTAAPAPEWTFVGWSGDLTSNQTSITTEMSTDRSFTVTFDPPQYMLNVNAVGGSVTIDPPGNIHVLGTVVTLTATPDSGRTFSGWSGDTTSTEKTLTLVMDSNKNLTASFPVNSHPVVVQDSYSVNEDDSLVVEAPGLLGNDSDPDDDVLSTVLEQGVSNGTLDFSGDGSFVYVPNNHFNGSDTLRYSARDGKGGIAVGLAILTIDPVNDRPVATLDQYAVSEDDSLKLDAPGIIENDSDLEGDPLTSELLAPPANGSITLSNDGSFLYVPSTDFNGADTFDYLLSDGNGGLDTAAVLIAVDPVNDPPVAAEDAFQLSEEDTFSVAAPGVLQNDADVDGDSLVTSLIDSTVNGALTLSSDGGFTYRPNLNFNGVDSFSYRIEDGHGGTSTAVVSLTVSDRNDAPVAVDDLYTINEDDTLAVVRPGVLENDTDIDGDTLTAAVLSPPVNGTLSLLGDGSFTFVPHAHYSGEDTLSYSVTDGKGGEATANVIVQVHSVNDPPVAFDDAFGVIEDDTLRIAAPGVLGNDIDNDADSLSASLLASPSKGGASLGASGELLYVPAADSNGTDTLSYLVNDGNGGVDTAHVTLSISARNDNPIAADDEYVLVEDDSLVVVAPGIMENDHDIDGDALSVSLQSEPENGTLTLTADGSFKYVPNANFNGGDLFTYVLIDGQGGTSPATVSLIVSPANDIPLAVADSFIIDEDDTLSVPQPGLLSNDSDLDGDNLTAATEVPPENGSVSINSDGSFNYVPEPHFNGRDSLTYRVRDDLGGTSTATVRIDINPVEDIPIAGDDVYFVEEFKILEVSPPGVLHNDFEPDGDFLAASLVINPPNGTVQFHPDGSFSYSADPGFLGTDTFRYAINDGNGGSDTASVSVTVNPEKVTYEGTFTGRSSDSPIISTEEVLTAVNGNLYLAAISMKPATQVTEVSGMGLNWTRVQSQCSGRSNTAVELWMAQGLPTGDGVVSASFVTDPNNAVIAVSRYSGVDRQDPIQAVLSGNTNGLSGLCFGGRDTENYSFDFTTTFNGSVLFGVTALREREHEAGGSFQERVEFHEGGGGGGAGVAVFDMTVDSIATTSMSGTFNSDVDWAFVGLEIKSGSTGGVVPRFTLSVNTDGSGNVELTPPGGLYEAGTQVTLTAVPASGWQFSGWSGGASGIDTSTTVTVNNHTNVTATFTEIPPQTFALNVSTVGQGSVSANPEGQSHIEGTDVTLTANPDSGWAFVGWNGDVVSSANPLVISIDSDKSVVATFEENEMPVATDDAFAILEDDSLIVAVPGVLSNDTDADGDSLFVTLLEGPAHGNLNLNSDGSFNYVPAPDSTGLVFLQYSVEDGRGGHDIGRVTLTIGAVNDAPIAANDQYQTTEDDTLVVAKSVGVLANDRDVDNDTLTAVLQSAPSNGILNLNGNGSFTFVPHSNFKGSDFFVYRVSDGSLDTTGTVTIQVSERNDVPVVQSDAYTVDEDDSLLVAAPGVLLNDHDADGDTISVALASGPTNGTVVLNTDGSFAYLPNNNFNGSDTFSYTAEDGRGGTAAGLVTLTVRPIPDIPTATADSYFIEEFKVLNVPAPGVLQNDADADGDILTVTLLAPPSNGVLSLNPDGSFSYEGNPGFLGTDTFRYQAQDDDGNSATAQVAITVNPKVVTYEGTVSGASSESSLVSTSGTVSGINGNLYLATIASKPFREVGEVVGLGLGWTRVKAQCAGRGNTGVEIWAAQGLTNEDGVVSATFASAPKNAVLTVSRYSGVDPDGAVEAVISVNSNGIDGTCSGGSDSDRYSFDFATTEDGSTIFAAAAMRVRTHEPGSNYLERFETHQGDGGGAAGLAIMDRTLESSATVTIDGSFDSDVDWAVVAIEIKSSSTGGVIPTFQLTLATEGAGAVSADPSGGEYELGTEVEVTAQPADGWSFDGWSGDLTGSVNPSTVIMDSDKSITAAFSEIPPRLFNLTFEVIGQGTVQSDPLGSQHVEGTPVTLAAQPDSGWVFVGWSGDVTSSENPLTVNMDSDKSVSAHFVENARPAVVNDSFEILEDDTLIVPAPGVLANDADADGDSLTASLADAPALGAASVAANGAFTYIPAPDSNGVDSFTYLASDGKGGTESASVIVTIAPVNDPPLARDDSYQVQEDDTLRVLADGVLANDYDPDGDALNATLESAVSHGTLVFNNDGSFSYIPNSEFDGSDAFSYSVSDGNGASASATVTLTVTMQNDPPIAVNDDYTVDEDDSLVIAAPGVLGNDSDSDGDPLSVTLDDLPNHGQLNLSTDGSLRYIPTTNFHGEDSFTYSLVDTAGHSVTGVVTVTVRSVEDTPVAVDDAYSVSAGNSLNVSVPGVLSNDTDGDGDPLAATFVSGPSNGTVSLSGDGSFVYNPNPDFVGADFFRYQANDGNGGSGIATVTITVNPAVVTFEEVVTGSSSETASVSTTTPVEPVTGHLYLAAIATKPYREVASVNGLGLEWTRVIGQCSGRNNTGVEVWMAQGAVSGSGTVFATLSDDPRNTVITVSRYSGVDSDNPLGTVISGNTLGLAGPCSGGNDSETYSFGLDVTAAGSIVYGAIAMRNKEHVPGDGFTERVEILHGTGGSGASLAVVGQTVAAPTIVQLQGSLTSDVDWAVAGLEIKSGSATIAPKFSLGVSTIGSGSVALSPSGGVYDEGTIVAITAVADPGWTFSEWSGDQSGGASSEQIVMDSDKQITATFVENVAPIAGDDHYSLNEDDTLTVALPGVLENDSDADADILTASLTTPPSHGAATINGDGSLRYIPQPNFSGEDTFIYSATDGNGGSTSATVTVTVNPVADPPFAQNDTFSVEEGDTLNVPAPGVLSNDTDPDADVLTATVDIGPSNGSLSFNPDGSFTYVPNDAFHGTDSFGYTVNDGTGGTSQSVVSLTVTEVNEAPIASDDIFSVDEDNTLSIGAPGVLTNDQDSDGDVLSSTVSEEPANGTLNLNADGSFSYTPDGDFHGTDSFRYVVNDNRGGIATATVFLTINSIPDSPVATDDSFSGNADNPLSVVAPGVLINDSDADGDNLSVTIVAQPSNGSVNLDSDGSFDYFPNSGFVGSDAFEYAVSDGNGGSDTGTVTILINPSEVTVEETVTGTSSEDTEISTDAAVSSATGHLYLATISTKPYREVGTVTGLGLNWTRLNAQCAGRGNTGVEIWLAQGIPGGNSIVSAQLLDDFRNAVIVVSRLSGVASEGAIGSIVSGNSNGLEGACSGGSDTDSYNFNITTIADGSLLIGAIAMRNKEHVAGSGYEERVAISQGTGGSGASLALVERRVDIASTVPFQGTFTADVDWAVVGVEVKAGSGGSQVPQFNLSTTSLGNGSVALSPDTGTYPAGSVVTATAIPDAGWTFSEWGGDVSGTSNPINVTMDSDKEVTAEFTELPPVLFSLTTSQIGNGRIEISPPGDEYLAGTEVTLTAVPDSGTVFAGWSGDLNGFQNPTSLIMDANKSITAQFIVNAAPVAGNDSYTLNEDDTLTVAAPGVLANDSDSDGDPLSVLLLGGPTSGTASMNPDGSFVYRPAPDYNGADLLTYTVSDGKGGTTDGTVFFTITEINDSPVASDDTYHTDVSQILSVPAPGVVENDFDADGDALVVSLVSGPTNGVLNLNANGSFTYTPNNGFSGSDQFDYFVGDQRGGGATGTVFVHVNPAVVTYEETIIGTSSNSTVVSTASPVSGDSGHLYLVAISSKPFREVDAVSGLGLIWTRLDNQCSSRDKTGLELWQAQGTPSGDGVVTANLSSTPNNAIIAVARYSGAAPVTPIGNVMAANSNGVQGVCSGGAETDAYSFGFQTTTDGSVVFAAVTMRERFHTPGSEYTERAELVQKDGGGGASISLVDRTVDAASSVDLNGTFDRDVDWALVAVEIRSTSALGKFSGTAKQAAEPTETQPPSQFQLFQNYPNPFNPSTIIRYEVPATGKVELVIFDIQGRSVATLVDGVKKAGSYSSAWDGKDSNGKPVASGVYFYRMKSKDFEQSYRMLLIR